MPTFASYELNVNLQEIQLMSEINSKRKQLSFLHIEYWGYDPNRTKQVQGIKNKNNRTNIASMTMHDGFI